MEDKVMKLRKQFHGTSNKFLRIYYHFKYQRLMDSYGCEIPLNVNIPDSTMFPHQYYGIFISGWAKIGNNCTIFHQVTIGSNTLSDTSHPGAPIIGDNVYIGAGAKLVGGVSVGNNVRIGANCIVFRDIPDNSTVVSQAPRIIKKLNINNEFISIDDLKKDFV